MTVTESIRYFDVLFVVDDKDYSKVYLNRMLDALRTVTPPLNIGKEYILDTGNKKANVRAEKVILLAEHPTGYIIDSLTQWIHQLRNRSNKQSKIMLINHAYQNQDLQIENVQVISVDDLFIVHKFWPDVLRFLFTTNNKTKKVHLLLKTDTDVTSSGLVGKSFISVKRCLDEFNIEQLEDREAASTSVVAVTKSFARSSGDQIQKLLAGPLNPYHTTHVLTTRAGDIVPEREQMRTSVHECKNTLLCILSTLIDAECVQVKRYVPPVPLWREMRHEFRNWKGSEFFWWLVIVCVVLFNLPAYLAYCCSPLTPLVLYIILTADIKQIKFFYTSNIIFTIISAILTGLAAQGIIDIPMAAFIIAMVYFLLVQTIGNWFLIKYKYLYCDGTVNQYGLLGLPRYIQKLKCSHKRTKCCINVWSVLKALMALVGVCNVFVSVLLVIATIVPFLYLGGCVCAFLRGPSYYYLHFFSSIILAAVIWPLFAASLLSLNDACILYFCSQLYLSGVMTFIDYFIIKETFGVKHCSYHGNYFNRLCGGDSDKCHM